MLVSVSVNGTAKQNQHELLMALLSIGQDRLTKNNVQLRYLGRVASPAVRYWLTVLLACAASSVGSEAGSGLSIRSTPPSPSASLFQQGDFSR